MQCNICPGGGAVDAEETEFLSGVVVLAKSWKWAALTYMAAWVLTSCCASGEAAWPEPALLFLEEPDEPMQSDMEADVSQGGKRDATSSDTFSQMCAELCTKICSHGAFRDWRMGSPGPSEEMPAAERLKQAILLQGASRVVGRGVP